MTETSGLPPRPQPRRSVAEHATAWLTWLGPVRLISTVVAVAVVVGGGYWLVRSPALPAEMGLPVAASPAPPASTLPSPSSPRTRAPSIVVVHVAGAVADPGVHSLDEGSRIADAIAAAGGATADGDLDGVNLAAVVADGQRVYVPAIGEVDPASVPTGASVDGGAQPTGPLDINRAGADELDRLPGVGPATAAAIVDDRLRNGPFASVDDLDRVPGIGPAKLAALRDLVTV